MKPDSSTLDLPMVIWSLDPGKPLRINAGFRELIGFTLEELETKPLLEWINPDNYADFGEFILGARGDLVAGFWSAKGTWVAVEWRLQKQANNRFLLGHLHQNTQAQAGVEVSSMSTKKTSLSMVLDAMALIVEAKNPGMMCSILLVDSKREYITGGAGPSLPDAYNKCVEGLRIGPSVGSCGTAAFWNVPVIVEDIFKDPLWKDLRGAAELAGVSACWSNPVTSKSGEVLGAMALYHRQPCAPKQYQLDSLEIAARMVGLAVEHHRLEGGVCQSSCPK